MNRRQRNTKKILKTILYWLPFIIYIIIIPPASVLSFAGFYLILTATLFTTLKTFFTTGRTIFWTGIIIVYLFLRQLHLDNILNTIILLGIVATMEIYFRKS